MATRDPKLRASDADRERVADVLRENAAQGRLTMEEFHSRLDACFQAVTYGDLDALITDLPGESPWEDLPVPASRTTAGTSRLPAEIEPSRWQIALGSYLSANFVCWVVWGISGAGGSPPWPVWVSGPWGALLLARAISRQDPRGHGRRG
jgi:hypothetical protein